MMVGNVTEALRNGEFNEKVVDVEELLEKIENVYGDLDDECGCYVNLRERNWMSVKNFVSLILECARPDWNAVD